MFSLALSILLSNYQLPEFSSEANHVRPPPPPFDVLTAPASELQELLKADTLASVEIITTYLAPVEKHNHAGAKLNAMISVARR
jgi:amidase